MFDPVEFLSAIMLICFGFSWPVNLIKNIRMKSAKSMNLGFIILIVVGYIAGIASRIVAGNYGYVFVIYIINLVMVSANIIVYIINKKHDAKRLQSIKGETNENI